MRLITRPKKSEHFPRAKKLIAMILKLGHLMYILLQIIVLKTYFLPHIKFECIEEIA